MLRRFNENDLPGVVAVEAASQLSPWSGEIFKKCFEAGSIGWVVELDQQLIGFIVILAQAHEVHILNLCIHPTFQHQGYGYQLLKQALDTMKEAGNYFVYLEVRRSNLKAIHLYQKMGFTQIGERKEYYSGLPKREDALVFAKDLSAE